MRRASVAQLKEQLSKYLRTVKAGEEILVTERGRPIARLGPVGPSEQEDARMLELIRAGVVRPPLRKKLPRDFWTRKRPEDPNGLVLRALLEERAESR